MNINERANSLADHLLDLEQQLGRVKQKRSQKKRNQVSPEYRLALQAVACLQCRIS